MWNGSLKQVLPESRDGMTASRDSREDTCSPREGPYYVRIHICDHKGIKPYVHLAQYRAS